MPASLKNSQTGNPIGSLATYSVSGGATPSSPEDSSAQVTTFSASVTGLEGNHLSLMDTPVVLEDWTGANHFGSVVSTAKGGSTNLVALDTETLMSRLNTEQTTYPIINNDNSGTPVRSALVQWCLQAGVPPFRIDGNLNHYIPITSSGTIPQTFGYIADNISVWRYSVTNAGWAGYTPSADTYADPVDVNASQTATFGAIFPSVRTLSSIRVCMTDPTTQANCLLLIQRNGNTWTVVETNGSTNTTHISTTYAPTTSRVFAFVEVSAAGTADKANFKLRLMERTATGATTYTDATALNKSTGLRNRPKPYRIEMGWDTTLINAGVLQGYPEAYFLTQASTLQSTAPIAQVTYTSTHEAEAGYLARVPSKIPGYTANVWDKLREFCSLVEIDISFLDGGIVFTDRQDKRDNPTDHTFIPAVNLPKSDLSVKANNRETARAVEVKYRKMVGDETKYSNTMLWKSKSVYSLEQGETVEEIVQTDSTFVYLRQPIPVGGVPVPYTWLDGSYVITGADGYIVDPVWWKDNGGSIKVAPTGKSGEIKITMQAPALDTVRAPYRVSEGVADRPALYVFGYGMMLGEPETLTVYTGATKASQAVGVTYDSVFMTDKLLAMNTGNKLARVHGTASSEVSFSVNRSDVLASAAVDKRTPLSDSIYWEGSYYRVHSQTVNPSTLDVGAAEGFNTIRTLNGEFATGKTIADWNALHAGKKIKDTNLAPLPNYQS